MLGPRCVALRGLRPPARLSSLPRLFRPPAAVGRRRPSRRTGTARVGPCAVGTRIPPMDAGCGRAMDEDGRRPCQQYGSGIGERAARIGKVHILPQPPATRTVRLLHRQRRRGEHRPYGTAFSGNGTHQLGRVRPYPRPPPSGLEERDAAHRPARAQGLPARHATSAAHRLLHRHVQQPRTALRPFAAVSSAWRWSVPSTAQISNMLKSTPS